MDERSPTCLKLRANSWLLIIIIIRLELGQGGKIGRKKMFNVDGSIKCVTDEITLVNKFVTFFLIRDANQQFWVVFFFLFYADSKCASHFFSSTWR